MRFWPWRRETRQSSSYENLLVDLAASEAGGAAVRATATAAMESCSGLLARSFAAAQVTAPAQMTAALSPALLSMIGRQMIRSGEIVFLIDVAGGRLRLYPSSHWTLVGAPDPDDWQYRVTMIGPTAHRTRQWVPAASVLHVRYQADPAAPWRGIGPIESAALAGKLSSHVTAALADEASGPRGSVLPLPVSNDDPTTVALKKDLKVLRGSLAPVLSTQTMAAGAPTPRDDWMQRRIGADPPPALVALLQHASNEIFSACGFSPALFVAQGEGTAQRESFRRAMHATIAPIGRIVQAELRDKLEPGITLNFDSLFAADLSGRARAFQSLVGGGMDPAKAAALSGLMAADDG